MRSIGENVLGICIKAFFDEDDLQLHSDGLIEENQIRKYEVGQECQVVYGKFDPDYFILKD